MTDAVWGVLAAVPWLAMPAFVNRRLAGAPSLDDMSLPGTPRGDEPRVSIVLPARNEALHIAGFIRAVRASTWPALEVIVVDDHSTDATHALALEAADGDPRIRVIMAPPLPDGWFGKQWACQSGAAASTGALLLFTDADTRHAPDLVARTVQMRRARDAELLSIAGRQHAGTIWERAVQPLVFALILMRYGTARSVERAVTASDVLANGQCFMLSRAFYERIGGHAPVRRFVAEDVMMAQTVWRYGGKVSLAMGRAQLSTRMYDGFGSLVRGWSKNVYAGGRHTVRGGAVGRLLYPVLLLLFPLLVLAPFIGVLLILINAFISTVAGTLPSAPSSAFAGALWWWSVCTSIGVVATDALINRMNGDRWTRGVLAPLGGVVLLLICMIAVARGSAVTWKERAYQAG